MGLFANNSRSSAADSRLRRVFDIAIAAASLALAAPVLLIAAAAIAVDDGVPVFFSQERVGRGGVPFRIFKLRSMTVRSQGAAITGSDDVRITRTGKILRRYKIDELPQLWNVLRGDISLVGPRPELATFVNQNDSRWRHVLSVRPGITDVATLLFRDEESLLVGVVDREAYYRNALLPIKLDLNIEYMAKRSLWRDTKLLACTIAVIIFPNSASPEQLRHMFLSGIKRDS